MADIAACGGKNCPLFQGCYRFTCRKDEYQSYADFEYKDGNCNYYWDNGNDALNKLNDATMS